ncbi:MAG: hypothetical protein HQM16_03985 [Deltaproteobacteria bacterium]|nr:hypothetical protein [Deltaproteobacteria bacterium]
MQADFISKKTILTLSWVLIAVHFFIFEQFFPNRQGLLGHDYSYILPLLLDGYYWFTANGIFSPHWFTPSFCGGLPRLANPQGIYYSLPQFLTFIFNPLTSLKITFATFSGLGFYGFYFLLRSVFSTQRLTALLGATLFLFNGYYAYRFVVGHLPFHSFMLVPLMAFLLLHSSNTEYRFKKWRACLDIVLCALLFTYMVYSGGLNGILPVLLCIVLIYCLCALCMEKKMGTGRFFLRLMVSGLVAMMISLPLLYAAVSFLGHFERVMYPLPGFNSLWGLLKVSLTSLFFYPAHEMAREFLVNKRWGLNRHEFEFGITMIPLLIVMVGSLFWLKKCLGRGCLKTMDLPRRLHVILILLILLVPIALNVYHPAWNAFLKQVPLIKTSSSLVRWFVIYIPFFIIAACLVIEKTSWFAKHRVSIVVLSLLFVVGSNILSSKEYYHQQPYNPEDILGAYEAAKARGGPPVISEITVIKNAAGQPVMPGSRNNSLAAGKSQMLCYEPIFGYRLELLPFKTMTEGPVWLESGGALNIKNPACYVYPRENHCEPGDHFALAERDEALAFAGFRPFHFNFSRGQEIANFAGGLFLLSAVICVIVCLFFLLRSRRGRPAP